MTLPGQTLSIRDPGLGIVLPTVRTPLWLGTSSIGTDFELKSFARKTDAVDNLGQGPLPEAVCRALDIAGGPQFAMKLTSSAAGTIGAVSPTRVGVSTGTVTTAGTPYDAYEVQVQIRKSSTGVTVGTGTFRYSLDDGDTWSEDIAIPTSMSFVIPSTNVTITFVVGAGPLAFEAGDQHDFDCVAPYFGTTQLASAVTALLASPTKAWRFMVLTGRPATASAGATLFGALATHLASFATAHRYLRALTDFGIDTVANTQTALAGVSDRRISVAYGTLKLPSSKPFAGWGMPRFPVAVSAGVRAAASLISTDLGRVASGPITGAKTTSASHDEEVQQSLNDHRIITVRTQTGLEGLYFTKGWIKAPVGSDYQKWQYGAIMDEACRVTYERQQRFVNMGLRTNADGTIHERDAARLETEVMTALDQLLLKPLNAEGTKGHVSAVSYKIDRTNNLQSTAQLLSEVAVRPLGYAEFISTQLGMALEV